ncbi:hypothetical protein [Vibrio galatheae]|uniref:hypothetical protein n=1 Tax=Vibrio galatheae TaxID=579748 RepID=UPI000AF80EDC|nr:hypothetical protein [Vibrio galatheae]
MLDQLAEITGFKAKWANHLEDPVNWVAFIREHNLSKEQQRFWRDHFNLPHTFDGELEV